MTKSPLQEYVEKLIEQEKIEFPIGLSEREKDHLKLQFTLVYVFGQQDALKEQVTGVKSDLWQK